MKAQTMMTDCEGGTDQKGELKAPAQQRKVQLWSVRRGL